MFANILNVYDPIQFVGGLDGKWLAETFLPLPKFPVTLDLPHAGSFISLPPSSVTHFLHHKMKMDYTALFSPFITNYLLYLPLGIPFSLTY